MYSSKCIPWSVTPNWLDNSKNVDTGEKLVPQDPVYKEHPIYNVSIAFL